MIRNSSSIPIVPGLVNFGNTCYANALLQALASCESYVEYVHLIYQTLPVSNPSGGVRVSRELEWQARMPLLRAISCCLHRLQPITHNDKVLLASSLEVLHAIGYHNRRLFSGVAEQQDVTEVLECIVSAGRSELNAWRQVHLASPVCQLIPSLRKEGNQWKNKNQKFYDKNACGGESGINFSGILMNGTKGPRLADQLERQMLSMVQFQSTGAFEGLLSHHLECRECGHRFDIQLNRFTSLHLPMIRVKIDEGKEFRVEEQTCLEDCLAEYFKNKIQGPISCPRCSFYCTLTSVTKTDLNPSRNRRKSESSTSNGIEERSSFEEEINNLTRNKRSGFTDIFASSSSFGGSGLVHTKSAINSSQKKTPVSSGGVLFRGAPSFDLREYQNNILKPRKSESFIREAAARKVIESANGCPFQDHHVLNFQKTLNEGGIHWIDVDSPVNAQVAVSKLPKILALSLQRKVFDGTGYKKIQGRIRYPLILDLSNYLQHRSVHNTLYRLRAIIVHFGDEHGGHYVTVRSVKIEGMSQSAWILASDDKIRAVSENVALGLEASLLLYEREPDKEYSSMNSQEAPVFLHL